MSYDQMMSALDRANSVRLERAHIRRRVIALPMAEGKQAVAELLLDPPRSLASLPISNLLHWIHRWGDGHTERLLHALEILPDKPLDGTAGSYHSRTPMTERQRRALAAALLGKPV